MKRLVVVGNGMAGVACLEQMIKHGHDFEITIFGDRTSTTTAFFCRWCWREQSRPTTLC